MDSLISVGQFLLEHKAAILGALLAISEVLGLVPSIKQSSIFGVIVEAVLKLKGPKV